MSLATAIDSPDRGKLTACECQRYEIEVWTGQVPEGADPGEYVDYIGTGCTQTTRRTFAPGHDARLKSLLIRAGAAGHAVRRDDGGLVSTGTAVQMADHYGFGHQVAAGIGRAQAKAAAKADKKAQPTRRAERAAAARPLMPLVRIKVGRWEYDARLNPADNSAEYTSANGETRVAAENKYTFVTTL